MTQIVTPHRLPELFSLSNGSSPLLSSSGRDHAPLRPEIEKPEKESVSLSETPLGNTLRAAEIDPPKRIDFSDESFITGEIDKLAIKGILGAAQGIIGREKMAMILS